MKNKFDFIFLSVVTSFLFVACHVNDNNGGNEKQEKLNKFIDSDSIKYEITSEDSVSISVSDRVKAVKELLEKDM
ncbi:MAG: hypothetical protein K6E54_08035 [Bacteroidaceae bacterium]|nr:hypothetical protein [Bacteroidaceae bacterium]